MRILITGGAGFIGSHLAERYLQQGDQVTIVDDLSTGNFENVEHLKSNPNFQFAIETVLNETVMDRLASECDLIVHLAAVVGVTLVLDDPVKAIETNVMGTQVVLRLANRYRKKIILASTSEIYGKGGLEAFGEQDHRIMGPITNSRWSYACSKALDEFLAFAYHQQNGTPTIICRLFNTIGPRQTGTYGMVAPRLIQQALAGKPLTVFGDGRQTRCFCNVHDVVEALIRLAETPEAAGDVFNIGTQEEVSILQLAERIIHHTASSSEIQMIPYEQAYAKGFEDMPRRKPNTDKIHALCGWQAKHKLDETLAMMVQFEKDRSLTVAS